jgi:hypothetical protein
VCDGDIFHEVALVEDVASGDGDGDVEEIGVLFGGVGKDTHFVEEGGEFGGGEGETGAGVEVGDFGGHFTGFDGWTETGAAIMFRVDLNWFNTKSNVRFGYVERGEEREGFGRVDGEHCDHGVDYDFEFGLVGGSAVDEDVCCIKCNLGKVAVDNRRKTENLVIRVVKDGIARRISNNMQILSNMFIVLHQIPWSKYG